MENLPELSPKVNASNRNVQLKLPIEDAPPRVRAFGLRTLDRRPLVGERDATGRICRAFRTSSAKAWAYSDVGYPHSATQWGAVVVDVDAPAKLEDVLHNSGSLLPNWVTLNKRNGHAHVAFPLETPVACHPAANEKPLAYLSDIEKKLISALGGDPNYSGALARNPITRPRWGTSTIWLRTAPLVARRAGRGCDCRAPGWLDPRPGRDRRHRAEL